MAAIKFSSLVDAVTGKVGGIVFQGTMYGPIARFKVTPRNPATAQQQANRSCVEYVGRFWLTLPEDAILQWNAAATPPLTGFFYFMSVNLQRCYIDVPPLIYPVIDTGIFERPEFESTFQ